MPTDLGKDNNPRCKNLREININREEEGGVSAGHGNEFQLQGPITTTVGNVQPFDQRSSN